LAVLSLHIGAILADSFAHVGWLGALVPFSSGYRATAVALGTFAVYTFVCVAVLGLARGRIATSPRGARVWRGVHGLAYVGGGLAMRHGLTAGTDRSVGWVQHLYQLCLVAVLGSVAARLLQHRSGRPGDRFADRMTTQPRGALR